MSRGQTEDPSVLGIPVLADERMPPGIVAFAHPGGVLVLRLSGYVDGNDEGDRDA